MARAKPKRQYSVSFPATDLPSLAEKPFALLLDDLSIDARKNARRCESFQTALLNTIGNYLTWQRYMQDIPSLREQVAELNDLESPLQSALKGLLALTPLSRSRLTHAFVDSGTVDPSSVMQLDLHMNRAVVDLAALVGALHQVRANWSKHRRGRRPEPVHILIQKLATLFFRFDADDHDDEASHRSARDAFIRHALNAFRIRAPRRFDDILRQ